MLIIVIVSFLSATTIWEQETTSRRFWANKCVEKDSTGRILWLISTDDSFGISKQPDHSLRGSLPID